MSVSRIFALFRGMSKEKKSAMAYMAAAYIQYAIAFLVTPLFARLLTTEDFGLVATYNSWNEIMGPIATLSIYQTYFSLGLHKNKNTRDAFASSMLGLSAVTTVAAMLLLGGAQVLAPQLIGIPFSLTLLMGVYYLAYPATRYWMARERFEYKYKTLFRVTVASAVLTPLIGIIFVISADSGQGIARLYGTSVAPILTGIFFILYALKKCPKAYDRAQWKDALKFCLPLVPHYLSMHILSASDRVMINSMIGESSAGIYGMAYTASMVITAAWTAISGSLTPYLLDKLEKKQFKELAGVSTKCIVFFSLLCLCVCLVAPELILFLGGEKYSESISLIPPLLAAVLFMEMYNIFSIVTFYHGKTKSIATATVSAAGINVALNYFAISRYGYAAAAYTTLICYILYCFFHYLNMRRTEKNKIYHTGFLIVFSVVYVLLCFLCLLVYDYPLARYGFILCAALAGLIWRGKIAGFVKTVFADRGKIR